MLKSVESKKEILGPIEIEEENVGISWNANDWPVYIKCPFNAETSHLRQIIREGWQLKKAPQIILCVISQYKPLRWDDEMLISRFKEGLIKAASAATMWVITNGLDVGASKMIAQAIENEIKWTKATNRQSPILQAKCIGVVREDRITSDPLMQRDLKDIDKLNETNPLHLVRDKYKEGKFYIDSQHSHFIFVIKQEDSDLEQLLALDVFGEMSLASEQKKKEQNDKKDIHEYFSKIPLIGIIIEGDRDTATVALQYLHNRIPVVVLWGTGGFADLVSLAFAEIEDRKRQEGLWDPDFVEGILNPMLSRKIVLMYPNLRDKLSEVRSFRDKVVECCREANKDYLTILNIFSSRIDLRNLDQYLLESYFKSRHVPENAPHKLREMLTTDIHLTLSWNNPVISRNVLIKRINSERIAIANELFLRALIEPKREEFIEIFLQSGFKVRWLYNNMTIKWLIKQATKVEFFQDVCCEGLLGISMTIGFPHEEFLTYTNRLILLTTGLGDFLKLDELTKRNRVKPNCIEQKCLVFLTIWALFVNNLKLVDKMIPFHNHPINMCLTITRTLQKMSKFISDISLQKKMEMSAVEYGELATKLLDEYYENSPFRARSALINRSPHWSYQSASDVAVAAEVHSFVAHASCQKLLTNRFLNDMHIKQSAYGEVGLPTGIKILLCAVFIFPINIWLDFPSYVTERKKTKKEKEKHKTKNSEADACYVFMQKQKQAAGGKPENPKIEADKQKKMSEKYRDIPFLQKLSIFWDAAITKYWVYQLAYILFLILFSYTVLSPSCGNLRLDLLVFIWIILIVIEDCHKTYQLLKKFVSSNAKLKYVEISSMVTFLCLFYLGRIVNFASLYNSQYFVRMLMCVALFYYYVRYLAMFIPISAIFGPMFYRLKLMALNDYIQYMLMIAPIMIGSAIVIRVSHFPDVEIDSGGAFHKMFHNTIYTLFKMFDDDLFERPECVASRVVGPQPDGYCRPQGNYFDPVCNNFGFWPYVFNIAFLVLMKLIVVNLMYALFNNSLAALDALTIWKFQRYQTITEFYLSTPLPPPLNIICYTYYVLKFLISKCYGCCRSTKKSNEIEDHCHGCPDPTAIIFARVICENVLKRKSEKEKADSALTELSTQSLVTTDHIEFTKTQVVKLRRTVTALQKMIFNLQTDVEATKLKVERHELSRTSPYPNTQIQRLAVSDKYVPWDVVRAEYYPIVYTVPKSTYPAHINADDDVTAETGTQNLQLKNQFKFNDVFVDENGAYYNRRSWITDNLNRATKYKVDEYSPLNPHGRTGLAGRGLFPRWGPNHFVLVLVTKFSTTLKGFFEALTRPKGPIDTNELNLLGGFIAGEHTYDIIRSQMGIDEKTKWTKEDEMIEYFEKKVGTVNEEEKTITEDVYKQGFQNILKSKKGLQYHQVYTGYLDSPYNTDNAWEEIEFWHFHYTTSEIEPFPSEANLIWTPVKEDFGKKMRVAEYSLLLQCISYLRK